MSQLPAGWASVALTELIAKDGIFSDGDWVESKDQDPSGSIRLLQLADVGDGVFVDRSNRSINDEQFRRLRCTEVLKDDVLIARMPDPLGRACVVPRLPTRCVTVVDVAIVRPGARSVKSKWLMHFLNAPPVRHWIELQSTGTTRRRIARGRLAQLALPVPPIREQQRIADKLDVVLARVDACRERLDRVPAVLKRFRQAVLAAATSGELTREWREEAKRASSHAPWDTSTLETLCQPARVITYGVIKLGQEVDGGVPCLRTSNVRWLRVDTSGMKRISGSLSAEYARTVLRGGEVLVNVRGTLGGVAVASSEMSGWNVSREVAVVPVDTGKVDPKYLAFWIGSERSQRWLSKVEKGVAYIGINIEDLRSLPVSVPRMDEQCEIVRRVETLLAFADELERRHRLAIRSVEDLSPAILAKAFRGELVPQDPSDEPASVLLARLRAERDDVPERRQRRRTTRA